MLTKLLCLLRSAFVCTISLLGTVSLAQTIRNVGPSQTYSTIQSGINAAADGDTVLVAPGTYYENIDFKSKAITVTSSGGAAATIIDGGNKGGVATVLFSGGPGGVTNPGVISGFTIRGGGDDIFSGRSDGGIYVSGTMGYSAGYSPTIENNIITANYCHNIDVEFSFPTIINNEISGVLQNTQGTGSQESYCGSNDAIYLGGTANFQVGGTVVVGNTIENNLAGGSGIQVWAAQNVLVMNNVIRKNYSRSPGSAFLSVNTGNSVVVQNLIYGNTSTCGGALSFNGGILIANNTIVDNLYDSLFSGSECTPIAQIYPDNYSYGQSYPNRVIVNNIISGSTSYPAVNCDILASGPPSLATQPTFQNNILYNAGGPFFGSYCVDVSSKDNNIASDPQFVSPSTGDYHLKSSSPAIDAGQNSVLATFLAMTGQTLSKDFDGNLRVQDATGKGCTIDMGAYEYPGTASICGTSETLTSSLNPAAVGQSVTFTAQLTAATGVPTGDIQFMDGTNVLFTQAVSGTGSAAFSTSSLAIGSHTITANYQPTGSYGATSASLTQIINGYATATTLTCLPNPINVFNTSLFAAAVTSSYGTPTGSIAFTDNGATLATQALVNGATSLAYTGSTAATHTITATYTPTGSFASSSATCSEVVSPLPTTSGLTVTPSTSTYGSAVTLSAAVSPSGSPGHGTPTGAVTFYDGTNSLAVIALDASGDAIFTTSSLAVGTHSLTAVYAGNTTYSTSTSPTVSATIVAIPTTTTLSVSPNPAQAFQFFTVTAQVASSTSTTLSAQPCFPTCTVTFTIAGLPPNVPSTATAPVLANGTATAKYAFAVGTYTFSASFNGSTIFAASTATPIQQTVVPATTTVSLAASPNPANQNQTVNLSGTLAAPVSTESPSGTMTYLDGTTPIGTAPFTGSALANSTSATLPISSLAPGTHTITVSYAGNANFLASTSAPITLTIAPQDFTINLASPTITIKTQHHTTTSLTLTSLSGFADSIALGCVNPPTYVTCQFTPQSATLAANASTTVSLYIDTDSVIGYARLLSTPLVESRTVSPINFAMLFAPIGLLATLARRRCRTRLRLLALLLAAIAISAALTGCGELIYPYAVPPSATPGTYNIQIVASGATTGITHTTQLTLTVAP